MFSTGLLKGREVGWWDGWVCFQLAVHLQHRHVLAVPAQAKQYATQRKMFSTGLLKGREVGWWDGWVCFQLAVHLQHRHVLAVPAQAKQYATQRKIVSTGLFAEQGSTLLGWLGVFPTGAPCPAQTRPRRTCAGKKQL
jgi:hypothetical protein